MKKIILIFVLCFLCVGCGKSEKNITINIYENKEKDIKEEAKTIEEIITEDKEKIIEQEKIKQEQTANEGIVENIPQENISTSQGNTVSNKVKDTYSSAKEWYNENKDELKSINNDILENDKNTINSWIESGKTLYEENKDLIIDESKKIYYNDKQTIEDLYNKIKN